MPEKLHGEFTIFAAITLPTADPRRPAKTPTVAL